MKVGICYCGHFESKHTQNDYGHCCGKVSNGRDYDICGCEEFKLDRYLDCSHFHIKNGQCKVCGYRK